MFALTGGVLGVVIGIIGMRFLDPIIFEMYHRPESKLSGVFEVGFVSLAVIGASGITGISAFSYFALKRRK